MHHRSKHWQLIDFVIDQKRDLRDVLITRAMRRAECWTDHRLTKLNFVIPPLHRKLPKLFRGSFNLVKLQQPQYLESFNSKLDEELAAAKLRSAASTEKWNQFKEAVTGTA